MVWFWGVCWCVGWFGCVVVGVVFGVVVFVVVGGGGGGGGVVVGGGGGGGWVCFVCEGGGGIGGERGWVGLGGVLFRCRVGGGARGVVRWAGAYCLPTSVLCVFAQAVAASPSMLEEKASPWRVKCLVVSCRG